MNKKNKGGQIDSLHFQTGLHLPKRVFHFLSHLPLFQRSPFSDRTSDRNLISDQSPLILTKIPFPCGPQRSTWRRPTSLWTSNYSETYFFCNLNKKPFLLRGQILLVHVAAITWAIPTAVLQPSCVVNRVRCYFFHIY